MGKISIRKTVAATVALLSATAVAAGFEAGFGRTNMDPPLGLSLQGYFEARPADGVLDPVQVNCVALSDGQRRALLFSLDLESLHGLADAWRGQLAKATGVDPECVYIACTHTHTGPAFGPVETSWEIPIPSDPKFDAQLYDRVEAAAKAALADLAPADIALGSSTCPGISFIRRFHMNDGSVRTNPGCGNTNIVAALGRPDETVQLVRFRRAKGDIAVVNFQCHPDVIGGCKYSADWPGFVRRRVEEARPGVRCVFFNGAQGDANHIDVRQKAGARGYEHSRTMGTKVADAALAAWERVEAVPAGEIRGQVRKVVVPLRKARTSGVKETNQVEAYRLKMLATKPDVWEVPVSAITVGRSLAFAGLPGEPFTAIGRHVKGRSPCRMTVFTCLTNGAFGYIPDEDSFEGSSYENTSTVFQPHASHLLVEGLIGLLGESKTPLDAFWDSTRGQTLRRIPVDVVPENAFCSLSNLDFEPGQEKLLGDGVFRGVFGKESPYNCITLTLRCIPDLSDKVTEAHAAEAIRAAHAEGIKVYMDTDVRIARDEFLRRWPDEAQGRLALEIVAPTNGTARFRMIPEFCRDHMCYSSRRTYDVFKSRIADAWAVTVGADGLADPATFRKVTDRICEGERQSVLSGKVDGLKSDERLVVVGEFTHWSADVFSPHLIPFARELMARYRALGADGAMKDEWGFPSTRRRQQAFRSFWYSPHFAAAWKRATGGRDMVADAVLMALPTKGREAERTAAIDTYFRLTYERNVEIETDFYEANKELWGPDVYVTKHATWYSQAGVGEYFHNGLSWWGAKRDWAQSDEDCDVSNCLGLMRTWGGPCWMNEGYGPNGEHYARTVWRYALCGGRMVYHGCYGGGARSAGTPAERKIWSQRAILAAGAGTAESRVRLVNLISRAQPVSAAAFVFGHSRLMNWTDPAFEDMGRKLTLGLGAKGYYADNFPSTALRALRVTDDGSLAAGAQRYPLVVLHRLTSADAAAWNAYFGGRLAKTEVLAYDCPPVAGATVLARAEAEPVVKRLEALGAVRQTPFGATGLTRHSRNRLPEPDGTLTLLDGTVVRIKGMSPDPKGDPVEGELTVGGVSVRYAATGLFAARTQGGEVVALAAGGLRTARGGGFDLTLDRPADVALVKRGGRWQGLLQTSDAKASVPATLKALTDDWRILVQPGL